MKITSLISTGVLEFNDIGSVIKGVSPILRDIKLNPNESKYLLDTSDVLLSAQAGDIKRFADAGKISVNDREAAVANGATVTLTHNFNIIPNVTVVKDPTGTPTAAIEGTDIETTHKTDYTETYVKNISGGALDLDIRIG